jgi:hypothetical protein
MFEYAGAMLALCCRIKKEEGTVPEHHPFFSKELTLKKTT